MHSRHNSNMRPDVRVCNYQIQRRQKLNNVLLLSLLLIIRKKRTEKRDYTPKRFWIRDIFMKRKEQGVYYNLLNEMRLTDPDKYFNYLRMSHKCFNELLSILGPKLVKLHNVREPISSGKRLAAVLRYLASGDSMVSLSYAFRIAPSTLSQIIFETCNALWDCLHDTCLLMPNEENWLNVARDFEERWQMPNCVGAIDSKHVVIQAPSNSGSTFYNYKGSHSIVPLALCDANYQFTMVDIGGESRHSDGGIFKNSNIGKALLESQLNLPAPSILKEDDEPLNYYIVADEAFPLTTCIMRPYPGKFLPDNKRIFNYRLSRARRVIENVFSLLAARWRIYRKPIIASQPTVLSIVKATVCLHNYIIQNELKKKNQKYLPKDKFENMVKASEWTEQSLNLLSLNRTSNNLYGREAEKIRQQLTNYFMEDGAVPFQWNK